MTGTHPADKGKVAGGAIVRQSGLASIAAMVAVGSGLILDVATAALYGAGADTDAFVAAARLPFALTAVLMVVSTQVLVPSFAVWFERIGGRLSHRLVTTVLLTGLLGGLGVAALLALVADPLLWLIAPGFGDAEHDLAVQLSRVMVMMIPLTAGSEVLRAWLNARHSFLIPAGMTLVLNVTAVGVLIVGGGQNIEWIPLAYVTGATVQFAFMLAWSLRAGFRPRIPAIRDPEIAALGRMSLRPTFGAGLNPVTRIAETFVASFLPAGSMTILHYGNRLVSAVGGTVLFRSVMVSVLPRLTRSFAAGNRAAASSITRTGIRLMAAASFPLTTFGVVLAVPLTEAAFGRGEFSGSDSRLLGVTLSVYALSFIGSGMQRALLAPFYAVRNTRVPLANTLWGVAANLVLLPVFVLPFRGTDTGVLAVAAAYSVAQYFNVGHAWWRLHHSKLVDLGRLGGPLLRTAVAALLGGIFAGGIAVAISTWWAGPSLTHGLGALLAASVAGLLGLSVTLAVEMTDPVLRASLRGAIRARRRGGGPDPVQQSTSDIGPDAQRTRTKRQLDPP